MDDKVGCKIDKISKNFMLHKLLNLCCLKRMFKVGVLSVGGRSGGEWLERGHRRVPIKIREDRWARNYTKTYK